MIGLIALIFGVAVVSMSIFIVYRIVYLLWNWGKK